MDRLFSVKQLRKANKIKSQIAADHINMSRQTYMRRESTNSFTFSEVCKLAELFNMKVYILPAELVDRIVSTFAK